MSTLRCGKYSCTRLGPYDLRRLFHRARLREFNEARSGKNAACGQHLGLCLRVDASGAPWRTLALEVRCVRDRLTTRRLFGMPGAGWDICPSATLLWPNAL